jgi:uncharacterized protein
MPTKAGETTLATLLSTLVFTMHPEVFVFATTPSDTSSSSALSALPLPLIQMSFREVEGTTLIATLSDVLKYCPDLEYQYPSRMITLEVHSSLEAVGFMAIIATKLADTGISCNPVGGYYHDHLFVPEDMVDEARAVLTKIAEDARAKNRSIS